MTEQTQPPDNVIRFPVEAVSRQGFHRASVRPRRRERMEREGQLSLFPGFDGGENSGGPDGGDAQAHRHRSPLPRATQPGPDAQNVPNALRQSESQPLHSRSAKVVPIPLHLGPFDEALRLDELGDERAEDEYLRAIESGDRTTDAWCNLGVMRSQAGDFDSAFDCFAQSIALDPMHAESHYNIGNLYFEIGDLRVSRTHYEIALDVSAEFANAWFNLGLVTALSEDYPTAHKALLRYKGLIAQRDEPSDAVADELLGYIRTAMNLS